MRSFQNRQVCRNRQLNIPLVNTIVPEHHRHGTLDRYPRCDKCGDVVTRVYPVHGGSLRFVCLLCGVGLTDPQTIDTYTVSVQGVMIALSGEQLSRPQWHCSQILSTSHQNLDAMRRIEENNCGKALPRKVVGNAMDADSHAYRSYGGTRNETFNASPVLNIGLVIIGSRTVLIACPRPSVATSTAILGGQIPSIVGLEEEWVRVTGSSNPSPIGSSQSGTVVGRTVESSVCVNTSRLVVDGVHISSTTYMSKLSFVLDSEELFGMTHESLGLLSTSRKSFAEPREWSMVLREDNKVTMRSTLGPTVILTYTGTICCVGSPVSSPVVLGRFFRVLRRSFRSDRATPIIRATKKVVNPVWTVSIGSVY